MHGPGDVAVDGECGADGGVPQSILHRPGIDTSLQEYRGMGMARSVEGNILESGLAGNNAPGAADD